MAEPGSKKRDFYDTSEVGQLIGRSSTTVRRYINDGIIEATRIGPRGDWMISHETAAELIGCDLEALKERMERVNAIGATE